MEEKALVGMTRAESRTVTEEQLACRVGSGTARVFATPCLAALMEAVCMHLVQRGHRPGYRPHRRHPVGDDRDGGSRPAGNRWPPVHLSRHRPG